MIIVILTYKDCSLFESGENFIKKKIFKAFLKKMLTSVLKRLLRKTRDEVFC